LLDLITIYIQGIEFDDGTTSELSAIGVFRGMNDFYKGITKAPVDYDEQDNFVKRNHQSDTVDNANDTKAVKEDTAELKKQLKGLLLIIKFSNSNEY